MHCNNLNPVGNPQTLKNHCLRYILDLSLSFRFYSVGHHVFFKVSNCSSCQREIIIVWVRNNIKHFTLKAHVVSTEIQKLIQKLEQVRFQSHDFNLEHFQNS